MKTNQILEAVRPQIEKITNSKIIFDTLTIGGIGVAIVVLAFLAPALF